MADRMEGGCLCGRVRFAAMIHDDDAYLCHCRMCQRASGNVSLAFKNVARADVEWRTPPDLYRSSPIAVRGHCATCGTTLTFDYPEADHIDLTVAAFDAPGRFVCASHYGVESRLDHWRDVSGLPEQRVDENPATVDRWMNAVGKLPD